MTKVSLDHIYQPLRSKGEVFFGLRNTQSAVQNFEIDLDPDFQRGVVWSQDNQMDFIGFLLEGGVTTSIILNEFPKQSNYAVVDGLQRMTAALRWSKGEIPGRLMGGKLIYLADLDDVSRRTVGMSIGLTYKLCSMTRVQVLEFYILYNSGGTAHSREEINRVKDLLVAEISA